MKKTNQQKMIFFLKYAVLVLKVPHYKKHFFEDTTSQDLNKCLIEVFPSINFVEFSHRSVGKVSGLSRATDLEFKSRWRYCKFLLNLKLIIFSQPKSAYVSLI